MPRFASRIFLKKLNTRFTLDNHAVRAIVSGMSNKTKQNRPGLKSVRDLINEVFAYKDEAGLTNEQLVKALNKAAAKMNFELNLSKRTFDNWRRVNLPRPASAFGLRVAFNAVRKGKRKQTTQSVAVQ